MPTQKPTITFDISPLESGHQGRGVGTYTRELQQALEMYNQDFNITFTSQINQTNPQLVHYPYFDLFFNTLPIKKIAPTIVTIHDVIPLTLPKQFPSGIKGRLRFHLQKLALRTTAHVITDSQASKTDIIKYLPVNSQHITVIPLAANSDFKPATQAHQNSIRKKYLLPKQFFLYVGGLNYNKNLPALITAIGQLNSVPLYIITREDLNKNTWEKQTAITTTLIKQAITQVPQQLINFLTVDSQTDLNALYSAATAYIQPSLKEGFGLPLLEAMASGTIVASSESSSLPEIGGRIPLYFDPQNIDQITRRLQQILDLTTTQRQQRISLGLNQATQFSWKQSALQTLKVYQKILNN